MKNNYQNFSKIPFKNSIEVLQKIQLPNHGVIVFGASGEMGSHISSTFPKASCKTIMQDIDEKKLEECKKNAFLTLEKGLSKKKISGRQWVKINKENLLYKTIAFPERGKIPFDEINNAYSKSPAE